MKKKAGIYIHIPFCKRFCFYCHFCKLPFREDQVRKYISALEKEIDMKSNRDCFIDTIYFGGGSPSLLPPEGINTVMIKLRDSYFIEDSPEITIEVNPEDLTLQKISSWKKTGINRISLGVQSFSLKDLEYLQRDHTTEQSINSIKNIQSSGISNISIDFIIGLPTQTEESILENIQRAYDLKVPHISAYLLEDVPPFEGKEQIDPHHYHFLRKNLLSSGYKHYEVSNYCLPEQFSRHNIKYWKNQPYVGLGLSASGFENGKDYQNTDNIKKYIKLISDNKLPLESVKRLKSSQRKIITGLRLLEGVSGKILNPFSKPVQELIMDGLLFHEENHVRVNPEKILLLNEILARII